MSQSAYKERYEVTLDPPTDDERIASALRFYLERCSWSSSDSDERAEFERLLVYYSSKCRC